MSPEIRHYYFERQSKHFYYSKICVSLILLLDLYNCQVIADLFIFLWWGSNNLSPFKNVIPKFLQLGIFTSSPVVEFRLLKIFHGESNQPLLQLSFHIHGFELSDPIRVTSRVRLIC